MIAPLANRIRLDEAHPSLCGSRSTSHQPFDSCFNLEHAREWGPCVLGIDQAMRGPLSAIGPAVFCGTILPCVHETDFENQGIAVCPAPLLSGNDHERLAQMVQNDSYVAWLVRVIPSEAADGARCSMGVLEHTTAASIIKEALAAGVFVRSIRVSSNCDPVRFRQFLFEAFPMIDDISVFPRIVVSPSTSPGPTTSACNTASMYLSPSLSQSLPSSPITASSPSCGTSPIVPPVICIAGVVAQSARDTISRQLLYKQRTSPSPLSRSPLSKPMGPCHRRDHLSNSSAAASFFNGPLFRGRSSSEENPRRCAAFTGSEFGDSHSGLVNEVPISRSQTIPIEVYDFYGEDEDSSMEGFTSPKRIRIVPCSPPLPSVISSEDSLPTCVVNSHHVVANSHVSQVDSIDSPLFPSTSLFVSPPPFASSSASTSAPMYRPMIGITSPF